MVVRDKIYINGAWVPSTGKGTLEVIDSATEEVFATIPEGTPEDVDKAVAGRGGRLPRLGRHLPRGARQAAHPHRRGAGRPHRRDRRRSSRTRSACR